MTTVPVSMLRTRKPLVVGGVVSASMQVPAPGVTLRDTEVVANRALIGGGIWNDAGPCSRTRPSSSPAGLVVGFLSLLVVALIAWRRRLAGSSPRD